jgi:tetratricopeptide (TPR) repeat protein
LPWSPSHVYQSIMPRAASAAVFLKIAILASAVALAQSTDGSAPARDLFEEGVAALNGGNPRQARELFLRATHEDPAWPLAHLGLGMAAQALDPQSAEALQGLTRAAELAPQNPRVRYQLGILYEQRAQPQQATLHFRAALTLRPTYVDAQFHLATTLAANKDFSAAAEAFRAALALEAQHLGALAGLADACEQLGALDQAEIARLALIAAQPTAAYHHYELGRFYERVGQAQKAKKEFARAERLDPQPQRRMRQLKP